jgi:hypothetical protein
LVLATLAFALVSEHGVSCHLVESHEALRKEILWCLAEADYG